MSKIPRKPKSQLKPDSMRIIKGYYHLDLYFKATDPDASHIASVLYEMSSHHKGTQFLVKIMLDYFEACGIDKPQSLSYEEILELPSIKELANTSRDDNSSQNIGQVFSQLLEAIQGQSAPSTQSTKPTQPSSEDSNAEKAEKLDEPVVSNEYPTPQKEETVSNNDTDEIDDFDDTDDDGSLMSGWASGLGAFSSN